LSVDWVESTIGTPARVAANVFMVPPAAVLMNSDQTDPSDVAQSLIDCGPDRNVS
jgi:hypothetical protein